MLDEKLGEKDAAMLCAKMLNWLKAYTASWTLNEYLAGKVAPVFFGSAINNFGVKEMLDTFIRIAPAPQEPGNFGRGHVEARKINSVALSLRSTPTSIPNIATASPFYGYAPGGLKAINTSIMFGSTKTSASAILIPFLARDKDVIEEAFPGDVVGFLIPATLK